MKTNSLPFYALIITLSSCSIQENTTLTFEKTNASLIQKSVQNLQVSSTLKSDLSKDENIVIVGIEDESTKDNGIIAIIEDQVVKDFVNKGYKVLERDNDIIYRLISESDTNYTITHKAKSFSNQHAKSTSASSIGAVDLNNDEYLSGNTEALAYNNSYYRKNYDQTLETNLLASDKLITYRVIECGVIYDIDYDDTMYDNVDVKREARTILEMRITDSKTGEILYANELNGIAKDTITENEYKSLNDFGYRFYSHSLPKIYGNPNQTKTVSDGEVTVKKPVAVALGIIGFVGTFIALIL